ncbi:hypothetical protein ACVK1X_001243 [Pseudomonas sp. PvR086]|uniref:hypothetical protein n=1 Tax=Pseudomonas TaxID=286 RepID=UPI0012DCFA4F|nr:MULTISPECIES: hypothetical protein [Pseudomonas]MBD9604760.1 hypothetical protein [Pseudomonas sp. PDM08]MBD9620594.1 hypothetical protein [Pseudomonas sp. PDM07]MDR7105353.1 hypothetical protein [Pseudomonas frederiksbergensis]
MTWKSTPGETSSPLLEGAQYQAPFHESSLIRLLFFALGKGFVDKTSSQKTPTPPPSGPLS